MDVGAVQPLKPIYLTAATPRAPPPPRFRADAAPTGDIHTGDSLGRNYVPFTFLPCVSRYRIPLELFRWEAYIIST